VSWLVLLLALETFPLISKAFSVVLGDAFSFSFGHFDCVDVHVVVFSFLGFREIASSFVSHGDLPYVIDRCGLVDPFIDRFSFEGF
jgi:hypothetical protein